MEGHIVFPTCRSSPSARSVGVSISLCSTYKMDSLEERIRIRVSGTGHQNLSKSWKNPADEYPATPYLLRNAITPSDAGGSELELAKLQYELYQLQQGDGPPVSKNRHEAALAAAKEFQDISKSNLLGFQATLTNSYSHLSHYLDTHVNNVGDPFGTGNYLLQTKFMERAVLDFFASLWRAEWPHDRYRERAAANNTVAKPQNPNSYWGFVLSMGSTEGALYGLWNARDYLSGKELMRDEDLGNVGSPTIASSSTRPTQRDLNALTPICFFSDDAHYTALKAMAIFSIRTFHAEATERDACGNLKYPTCPLKGYDTWPKKVPCNRDGSINVEALVTLVEFFAQKGYPPLIYFSYGSTFKGSYDDIESASHLLIPILDKYGLLERFIDVKDSNGTLRNVKRNGFWFHVDGALGAAYMPFLRMAQTSGMYPKDVKVPEFDFSLRGPTGKGGSAEKDYSHVEVVNSISMSAHKWIGAPFPSGVFMTKSKFQMMPLDNQNVVGTLPTTLANSRNALAAVILWDYFARHSFNQLMEKVVHTETMATYLTHRLQELNDLVKKKKLHTYLKERELHVQHYSHSLCVVFRRPNDRIIDKYSLSRETENGRHLVHVYCMGHVSHDLIDKLIENLSVDGAFEEKPAVEEAGTFRLRSKF